MLKKSLASLFITTLFGSAALAQALTPIKVSYQPALYWALPFYVATEKGWWKEVGLEPEFSTFPAGVPQIASAAAKSWDVGGTGSVPAVLGYQRFGIKTIGITNDESAANALVASSAKAAEFAKDPVATLRGQTITLTANSTADYAIQSCLKKYGLKKTDVLLKNMGQSEIISALSSGNADLTGLWAPNIYTVEEKAGAKVLCSGKEGGAMVPGALIARGDYAKEHPELVAKFVAVYLHAWAWMGSHRTEEIALMKDFYNKGGVTISDAMMNKEFDTRPTFDLATQIKQFDRASGAAVADGWFTDIGGFMKETGAIASVPDVKEYVTGDYLKLVEADPKLRDFANNK